MHSENSGTVLVVIPARGGSKGIPKKNLKTIHEKSITEWAIISAGKILFDKRVVVSSDDDEILSITDRYAFAEASKRPNSLSGDYVADFEVLRHELSVAERLYSVQFSCVVMLQPTSPIRNPETLNSCINSVLAGRNSSAWTIGKVPLKYHPRKQMRIKEGIIEMFVDSPLVVARQELDHTYIRTGVCYAISRETLLQDDRLLGNAPLPYICDWEYSNIDDYDDLRIAEEITVVNQGSLVPRTFRS